LTAEARLRLGRTAGLLLAVVLVSGCGVKEPGELPVRTLEDGRLSIDPSPITLADLARRSERTPGAALRRLWFSIQWWDEPGILAAYAPAVANTLGAGRVIEAWEPHRGSLIGSRLHIIETSRNRTSAVVTFTRETRSSPPIYGSATMVREGKDWRILHDTMLDDALGGRRASARLRALTLTPSR
jgi:hypothetical protein